MSFISSGLVAENKQPTRRALIIGINYFGTPSELAGCVNDSKNWRDVLEKQYGFLSSDVVLMTDEQQTSAELIPTLQNILKQIDKLIAGASSGDSLVFAYSGHGSYVRDRNGDEKDRRDETIIPLDYETAGELTDDVLRRILVDRLPAGARLTVIADSCFSGTIMDLRFNAIPKKSGKFSLAIDSRESAARADVVCISGCRDNQTSADTVEESQNVGALSYALQHVLKEVNYSVTHSDLLSKVRSWLKTNGYDQIPQMSFGRLSSLDSLFSFSVI